MASLSLSADGVIGHRARYQLLIPRCASPSPPSSSGHYEPTSNQRACWPLDKKNPINDRPTGIAEIFFSFLIDVEDIWNNEENFSREKINMGGWKLLLEKKNSPVVGFFG